MSDLDAVVARIAAHRDRFVALADAVWETPEPCYAETRSAAIHASELAHHGFRVETGLAGIPTALSGEIGEGGPVIAFLGEYDALPGLSQQAGVAEPRPVEAGGCGHGCGHNLLGAGAMLAAVATADVLAREGLPGRVRYYGCPAEEGGAAKTFMVRAGVFDDVDVAIGWHPSHFPELFSPNSLANTRVDFAFTGRASHAAAAPELGRSALDAVELMNVGVNYMREHMPSDARVHYAVLDAGGIAPNVVQAQAKVRYAVRARDLAGMRDLVRRVGDIARGAALMTETTVDIEIVSAVSNLLGNTPLEIALDEIIARLGPPAFDDADRAFAAKIRATLSATDVERAFAAAGLPKGDAVLADRTAPRTAPRRQMLGSTDVGDVSRVVPTVQAHGAVMAIGTPFHSWQLVAQGRSPAAHRGMIRVAEAMAGLGVRLFRDPALVAAAKADLAARTGATPYVCPIPDGVVPPIAMSTRTGVRPGGDVASSR
jgi:aminobenzoyl-glutamate utilization protein B